MVDITIEKVYPIAYLEFIEMESGEKRREGPRNEKEESVVQDQWLVRDCVCLSCYEGFGLMVLGLFAGETGRCCFETSS